VLRLGRGIRKLYGGGSEGCQWTGMGNRELGDGDGKCTPPMPETLNISAAFSRDPNHPITGGYL
jgi:hypothetical protein